MKHAAARALDGWAVGLAGLCLAHCLALPVMALMAPALGAWERSEWMHVVFMAIAAPLTALALLRPMHGRRAPPALIGLGGLGVLLLAAGAFGPDVLDLPMTVAGSVSLVAAHAWNWRRHRPLHAAAQVQAARAI